MEISLDCRRHAHNKLALVVRLQCHSANAEIKIIHHMNQVGVILTQHKRQVVFSIYKHIEQLEPVSRIDTGVLDDGLQTLQQCRSETLLGVDARLWMVQKRIDCGMQPVP
jgi:hypothetical protein